MYIITEISNSCLLRILQIGHVKSYRFLWFNWPNWYDVDSRQFYIRISAVNLISAFLTSAHRSLILHALYLTLHALYPYITYFVSLHYMPRISHNMPCILTYSVSDTRKICKCRYGYIGWSCEHKDNCQKPESRCLNNGNCTDSGRFCDCTDHFYGTFCENKNACFSMPCGKDQTCVLYENSTDKYSCKNSESTLNNLAIYFIFLIIFQ